MKSLASKLRTGAMIGLAGLALGATAPKANATIAPQISTIVYEDVDQDLSKPGFQVRYDWSVRNVSPPASGINDAIWKYAIDANLEARGMYGFTNLDDPTGWNYNTTEHPNAFVVNEGDPVYPGGTMNFSALIDRDLIIGNEQVQSTATANSSTYSSNVTVPIPEPLTLGLLASGAGVLLAGRRLKENYKQR
jgi:hypothetical protein